MCHHFSSVWKKTQTVTEIGWYVQGNLQGSSMPLTGTAGTPGSLSNVTINWDVKLDWNFQPWTNQMPEDPTYPVKIPHGNINFLEWPSKVMTSTSVKICGLCLKAESMAETNWQKSSQISGQKYARNLYCVIWYICRSFTKEKTRKTGNCKLIFYWSFSRYWRLYLS